MENVTAGVIVRGYSAIIIVLINTTIHCFEDVRAYS